MEHADIQLITNAEVAQGWHASVHKYFARLKDQENGKSIALVAEYQGDIAGYINIYLNETSDDKSEGIPEIVDFGVLQKYQRKEIGTALMDVVEKIARQFSDKVCLKVGLHKGYGNAQRMYVKRGYISNGSGVWYKNDVCKPHGDCKNDDDLVLRLEKKLN